VRSIRLSGAQVLNMEFSELIRKRYSVRSYRPDPVESDKLQFILEAARLAPSACNLQPFQILVIPTEGREQALQRIYMKGWFVQAPMVLCVCGLPGLAWVRRDGRSYLAVDAAIVMDHIILAATDMGLGTCWIAAFDAAAAREVLNIPRDVEPLLFTPLGYPADQPSPKERKPLSALVRHGSW
jgi:nitroreductase